MNKNDSPRTEKFAALFKSGTGRAFFIVIVIAIVLSLCIGVKGNGEKIEEAEIPKGNQSAIEGTMLVLNDEQAEEEKKIEKDSIPIEIYIPEEKTSQKLSDAEALVKKIYESSDIYENAEGVFLSYSQPDIPEKYHLCVKAGIYSAEGATLARFVSDSGWLSDPDKYDPSEKTVLEKLDTDNLTNKMFILQIRISEETSSGKTNTVYQLIQNADGSRELQTSVY